MFDKISQNTSPKDFPFRKVDGPLASSGSATEDIFSNVDKKPAGEVEVPAKINFSPVSNENNNLPLENNSIQFKPKSNKILTIIIIFLAVILFCLAGFCVYAQYIKQDKEISFDNLPNNPEQNIGNVLENLNKELEQPVAERQEEILPPATEPEPKIPSDIDKDGLSDEEEILLGTNPSRADTDLDGLSDYDEVKVYFTNPIKNDTDGDGYMDGIEVQNGYDPNGPGKLTGKEEINGEWNLFTNNKYGYWFKYPKDLLVDESNLEKIIVGSSAVSYIAIKVYQVEQDIDFQSFIQEKLTESFGNLLDIDTVKWTQENDNKISVEFENVIGGYSGNVVWTFIINKDYVYRISAFQGYGDMAQPEFQNQILYSFAFLD